MEDRFRELLAPLIGDLGYELVGAELHGGRRNALLRIYIDRPDQGITVDDCERVSREVSALLDVEDPIQASYTLEVSSPGLDRPLFTREHYARFVGHPVRVALTELRDGRRRYKGVISEVGEDTVTLDVDGEAVTLELAAIKKANLIPEI